MSLSDKMNNAYIRSVFNDTYLVSGQQFMPFETQLDKEYERLVNCFGNTVYPVLMSLCMPVFLNQMVMEKEQRLI